jgi:hypothetical protein
MAANSPLYSVLQLREEGDIRLVKLLQFNNGEIACELSTANLHRSPDYVAISYTWGPSTNEEAARGVNSSPSRRILCNGHPILVTENLHAFLVSVARKAELLSRYMWIDSICIDQSAPLERTSQVELMATIYHSAATVIVWLGKEDEHTKGAFALLHSLGQHPNETLKRITPRNLRSGRTLQLIAPCSNIDSWESLVRLFQRRYFTRVWIIQEITLAREVLVHCGQHIIDWAHVVKVSNFLTVTSWTRWICPGGTLGAVDSPQSYHAIPNLLEANKRTRERDQSKALLYALIRARRFYASDPRDKIYALLGVGGDLVTGKPRYSPVYGDQTPADTYVQAAIQLLLDADDLLLLGHAEGEVFQTVPGLPSWVPDWSSAHVVGLGVTGYQRFSAAGDRRRTMRIEGKTLVVSGMRIDTVTSTAESKQEILQGKPFPRLLDMLCVLPQPYHTKQSPSEVLWRTLSTDTGGLPTVHPAPQEYAGAFLSWFRLRLRETAQYVDSALFSKVLERLEADGLDVSSTEAVASSDEDDTLGDSKNMPDGSEYETIISHSQHLRPFLTSLKYFGLGSESLRDGDEIWIIAGSRVPLALRQADQGLYRLVGGAYMHGFMNGEAMKSGELFREIMLV